MDKLKLEVTEMTSRLSNVRVIDQTNGKILLEGAVLTSAINKSSFLKALQMKDFK